jgi:hypothetical protein
MTPQTPAHFDTFRRRDRLRLDRWTKIAGERFRVPKHAQLSIEHERSGDTEEVELRLRWTINSDADDSEDGPDV